MAKIDLESLGIEELAALRDSVIEKLAEKVAVRQIELEAELERLSGFGKPAKKAPTSPVAKPKKDDPAKKDDAAKKDDTAKEKKDDAAKGQIVRAA